MLGKGGIAEGSAHLQFTLWGRKQISIIKEPQKQMYDHKLVFWDNKEMGPEIYKQEGLGM